MKAQLNALSLAVALASVAISQNALATANEEAMEEVVATASPIRDSQIAALEAKRDALNTVDVIAADTIGRFPDQNLADSLGRVPGIAIERDQGQARYINFRGTPFRYTKIAIDGIDIVGAEGGRIPRFDSFPSMIVSRVEANKAITAAMPAEAIAGFVNISTFDPFAQEGFGAAVDLGSGEQELGGGDIDKQGIRLSWSNDKFGAVLYRSFNARDQITDNREYDLEHDDNGDLVVNELDFRSYKVRRTDSAAGGRLEYRGEGMLQRAWANTFYSKFVDYEERNQFIFDLGGSTGTSAEGLEIGVARLLEYGTYLNSTRSHSFGADIVTNDWMITPSLTRTETRFDMFLPILRSVAGSTTGSYDLSDIEDPTLTLDDDLSDIGYYMTIGIPYTQALRINEYKAKIDASTDLELFGMASIMDLGIQLDRREGRGWVATYALDYEGPGTLDIDGFNTGKSWYSNTTNTIGGTYYNNKALRQAYEASGYLSNTHSDSDEIFIDEDVNAAYAMTTANTSWGNLVAGIRIEQTSYSSEGTMEGERVKVEDDFTHVLPSLHANWNLTDDIKVRGSFTTGITRPNYNEWRAAVALDVTEQTATGGNPDLDAEESRGFDTAIEWYFAPGSILSAGAFYRSIDNVIYADGETVDGGRFLASEAGTEYQYTGYVNGSDGMFQGVEFNAMGTAADLLPAPFDGFGLSANLAFLNSHFKDTDGAHHDLPGTSDSVYNLSAFYEKYGFSARVNYMYRDQWVSPIEDPSEVWGEQQRVDMTLSYELPVSYAGETSSVYFNGNNLTNETDNRYAGNGTINQSESYGRSYLLGLRVNY